MKQPVFEGSITDVHGIRVGQAQNAAAKTGVTVILASHDGAVVGADVRGAAPGTRETDLCAPENTVERANAVVLAGGSAFGLAAATGVMDFLEKHQAGMDMGVCHVPIVPGAVIFDLTVGDAHVRPDAAMGIEACKAASKAVRQGAFGAGTGATVGKLVPGATPMQSGVGTASLTLPCGRKPAARCGARTRYPAHHHGAEYHHRRGGHRRGHYQGAGEAAGYLRA